MADDKQEVKIVKIYMDGMGKMSWDIPKEETVQRSQIYQLLGMTRYAQSVLLDMLKQPTVPKP
jgi:hypothetical protein